MASPQCEEGYTKIANELLEAMCRLHLSGNQWKVLHTIIRKTYGWNKTKDFLTGTQIAELTGMYSTHVYAALRVLRERKIITWHKRLVSIQKDYDQWKVTESRHSDRKPSQAEKRRKPVTRVTDTCHGKVTDIGTHKRKKDTISKDKALSLSRQMFGALAGLCSYDLTTLTGKQRGGLNQSEKILRKAGATPESLELFSKWWYASDWRGQKGQSPSPSQVRAEWGRFAKYRSESETRDVKWIST